MAKKHSNILIVNPWTDATGEQTEENLEYLLAVEGIRARCYSLSLIHKLCKKNGIDWTLKQTITKSLASSCDAVYVTGIVSDGCVDEILRHIKDENISVFADDNCLDYLESLGITTVQSEALIEFCRHIVDDAGKEVPDGTGR